MKYFDIEKYMAYRAKIIDMINSIYNITEYETMIHFIDNILKDINAFVQFDNLKSFYNLQKYIYEITECVNYKYKLNIEHIRNDIKKLLIELYRDLIFSVNIIVYFIGEDKYGFIKSDYTNIKINKINSLDDIYIKKMI